MLRGATLKEVRPTSNRLREALFARLGDTVEGARVLDLFAGSGALGIEALSRGAATCVFVEKGAKAAATIKRNLEETGLIERARVIKVDAEAYLGRAGREGPFDLVLIDPPYSTGLPSEVLSALNLNDLLSPGAVVVVEVSSRVDPPDEVEGYSIDAFKRYGDSALIYLAKT